MLSRVADCLYWMSRYVERSENIARMLDVNLQLMLDIPILLSEELNKNWLPIAACLGEDKPFRKRFSRTDAATVTEFLVFDREHPNSIVSCLASARENARTVRGQISTEMWEQINRSYLWSTGKLARQTFDRNQCEFFQEIREISHLFQGITDASMAHDEGWSFIQIGKYLERADKTSRALDDKFHLLRRTGKQNEHLQWISVLRSCSGRQAYQKIYVCEVEPEKVTELLVLNRSFPRSVRSCVHHLDDYLRRISGVAPGHYANEAEKQSGRLLAELNFSAVEDIYEPGLHHSMDVLQTRLNQIGEFIFKTYLHQAVEPSVPTRVTQQQRQAPQE